MIEYKVSLNNGIEAFGVDQKTITANEDVKTCDETALDIAGSRHSIEAGATGTFQL